MRRLPTVCTALLAAIVAAGCSGPSVTPDVIGTAGEREAQQETMVSAGRAAGAMREVAASAGADAAPAFHFPRYSQYRHPRATAGAGTMNYEAMVVADVTGDRRDDVVAMPDENELHVFVQGPDGRFAAPRTWTYGAANYRHQKAMVVADFNSDGIQDVATNGRGADGSTVTINVLLSSPGGALAFRQVAPNLFFYGALQWAAGDIDRDGNADIAAFYTEGAFSSLCGGDERGCAVMRVAYGDGKGDFPRDRTFVLGPPAGMIGPSMFDTSGDGRPDIVYYVGRAAPNPGRLVTHTLVSGDVVGPARTLLTSTDIFHPPVIGDFNGDGRFDVLVLQQQSTLVAFVQAADGTFPTTYHVPTHAVRSGVGIAADFDGDDRLDVATVQMKLGSMSYLPFAAVNLQRGGVLEPPVGSDTVFATDKVVQGAPSLGSGDLDGDGCRDFAMAAGYEGLLIFYGANCLPPRAPPLPDERGYMERVD